MLDLKSKLLAAGLVTADQVKKVEDEEAAKKQREKERREAQMRARENRDSAPRDPRDHRDRDARGKHGGGPPRGGPPRGRDRDRKRDDKDEKRAQRDHKEEEAQRWRKRLDDLKAAPKSEQYDAVRGWVDRHRLDDKNAIPSENATRFHYAKSDGTIGHVTLEPDVQAKLAAGEAGIIAFMGHNGLEHAAVPADLARDIHHVKPEWLRSLVGITDVTPPEQLDAGEQPPEPEPAEEPGAPEAAHANGASGPQEPSPAIVEDAGEETPPTEG